MKRFNWLLIVGHFAFQSVGACDFLIPGSISKCAGNITRVLQQVSSCKKAEQVVEDFSRSANLSSDTLCSDIVNILRTTLTVSELEKVAGVVDHIGVGAWVYLATRALIKSMYRVSEGMMCCRVPFKNFCLMT